MACHAIRQRSSPFLTEGRCRLGPRKSTELSFSLLSWPATMKGATDCRSIVLCCRAAPTAPREETIKSGNVMAEISRSQLSTSIRENGLGAGRKDADGAATPNAASADSLDRWLRDSVTEIVQHIQEAPFFVCLYSRKKGPAMRLEREMVTAEGRSWPRMKRFVREKRPDGIILVEELKEINKNAESSSKCSKLWGLLIQGEE